MPDFLPPFFYRWELTPKDLYSFFNPKHMEFEVSLVSKPFKGPKLPLEGTPYTYQYGISDTSIATDIAPLRKEYPNLPLTGDKRAGILIFHGSLIIASYVIPGNIVYPMHQLVVREKYQGQRLGARMIEQWYRDTPGVNSTVPQDTIIQVARLFLRAHSNLVKWAVTTGKPVPERVKKAVDEGKELQELTAKLNAIGSPK